MKLRGEWEMLLRAFGLSFPRDEMSEMTLTSGASGVELVPAAGEQRLVRRGRGARPGASNCGRQK